MRQAILINHQAVPTDRPPGPARSVRRDGAQMSPAPVRPWVSAVPRILLEWFEDRRAEGSAPRTCVDYALDLKDLAGFLVVPLEEATAADLRAYRRRSPGPPPGNGHPCPEDHGGSGVLRLCPFPTTPVLHE